MIKKIKVGGIYYDVEYKELLSESDTQLGWCRYDKARIEINNTVNEQVQEQTLIHELTHAIVREAGIDDEIDEDNINKIGLILHQVLRDNDFSFIRENEVIEEIYSADGKVIEKVKVTQPGERIVRIVEDLRKQLNNNVRLNAHV